MAISGDDIGDIKPEEGKSIELGTKFQNDRSLTPVTFFFTSGVFPLQDEKATKIIAAISRLKLILFFINFIYIFYLMIRNFKNIFATVKLGAKLVIF